MDDGGTSVCFIILFFVLLFLQAILYGFQNAFLLINEKEVERKASENKDKRSVALLDMLTRSTIHMNSIQLVAILVQILMGYMFYPLWIMKVEEGLSYIFSATGQWMHILAIIIALVLLMYIMLVFGMLLPKKIARRYPDSWAYHFIVFINFIKIIFYPFTGLVAITTNLLLRIMGMREADEPADVTEEEIISMVNEGHEQGVLEASEAEMITNIFEYGEKEASDIMTHRNNIIAIDQTTPFKEALNLMLEESNSRYPVYEENLDHITGVLYLKDAMRIHTSDESLNKPICKINGLIREAVFVPETKNIDDLFKSMQSQKNQMVIVMDEYGQTSGLVTMEDILEEIVGNIMDEYDDDENHIEEKGDNEYLIEGMTRLEDLEERFHITFDESEFETLNGYLISKLDRIPNEDEKTEILSAGYKFKIMSVEKNVIQSVLVTKIDPDEQETLEEQNKD